jgi:hypothetical protein
MRMQLIDSYILRERRVSSDVESISVVTAPLLGGLLAFRSMENGEEIERAQDGLAYRTMGDYQSHRSGACRGKTLCRLLVVHTDISTVLRHF